MEFLPILPEALGSTPAPHQLREMMLIPALGAGGQQLKGSKSSLATLQVQREKEERESSNSDLYSPLVGKVPSSQSPQENPRAGSISHQESLRELVLLPFLTGTKNTFLRMPIKHQLKLNCLLKTFPRSKPGFPFFLSSFCL